jgi:hypothetical protein
VYCKQCTSSEHCQKLFLALKSPVQLYSEDKSGNIRLGDPPDQVGLCRTACLPPCLFIPKITIPSQVCIRCEDPEPC